MIDKNRPKNDELFKKSMENPYVAQEFLTTYLPKDILKVIDTKTLKLEKDSFIEDDLRKSFSDVLLSCKFNNQDGYIFLLLEQQSAPEHFMAFRLFKYMVNICSQYLTKHPKAKQLPVIYPCIIYNGKKKYNVPRNIWDLFNNPDLAKKLWTDDYSLINVHEIPDAELKEKIWSGILLFFLKHIHERQLLKSWQEISDILPKLAEVSIGYDHIRNLLQYSLTFIDQNDKMELEKILTTNLSKEKGEELVTSIAQAWENQGMQKGIQIGEARGEARGEAKLIQMMIKNGSSIEEIARMTRLSITKINELLKIRA
jgi:predicted transposase/invertase (TIGR01784 family)